MNVVSLSDLGERTAHRFRYWARLLDPHRRVMAFSSNPDADALQRIYVINLDHKPGRWSRQRRELNRFRDRSGAQLTAITRRFSAVDARYLDGPPDPELLDPTFTLADQLTIDPNPLLTIDENARAHTIRMSRQEVAVALSHIEVWRLVATGEAPSALILEDDVFLPRGFARRLDSIWSNLTSEFGLGRFDLLFLSFKDVGAVRETTDHTLRRRRHPGLWQASGYVLTKRGAQRLLSQLPAYGPIDLWLNLQFPALEVLMPGRPVIEQNIDEPSTNSYSILPVLSQSGVITNEKPLVPSTKRLDGPVVVVGDPDTGLTSIAKALSMLGYTCCSDLDALPDDQLQPLLRGRRRAQKFNAYVNIGNLGASSLQRIADSDNGAVFITTGRGRLPSRIPESRILHVDRTHKDKWEPLSAFLGVDYPSFPFPREEDLGQRTVVCVATQEVEQRSSDQKFDRSPWVIRPDDSWHGIGTTQVGRSPDERASATWEAGEALDSRLWRLRDDTFPSNLARFAARNFHLGDPATIRIQRESTTVRQYTSAAVASTASFLYGTFSATVRPARGSGLITGIFLHRNGPRQEIDIEFLGKDPTKMLVNVYYNPGPEGTKLEYGYRGTPTIIDLGFDASAEFHTYTISWKPDRIEWLVDGELAYHRVNWNPSPIPDQPLEFNLNLWTSRSTEFAGRLDQERLPATASLRSIQIDPDEIPSA